MTGSGDEEEGIEKGKAGAKEANALKQSSTLSRKRPILYKKTVSAEKIV
jgi:hypothetical protein